MESELKVFNSQKEFELFRDTLRQLNETNPILAIKMCMGLDSIICKKTKDNGEVVYIRKIE